MAIMQTVLITLVSLFTFLSTPSAQPSSTDGLLVLNKSDNTADLFRLDRKVKLATFPTGEGPHEAVVTPDGLYAVIANYGTAEKPGHTLTVVNLRTLKVERTIDLGSYTRPHGLDIVEDHHIIVTTEGAKSAVIVDLDSGTIKKAIPTNAEVSHMVVVSPDRRRAYVANIRSGSVSVLDLAAGKYETSIPTGKGAEGITLTHNGKYLWVTNRAENTVVRLSTDAGKIDLRIPVCEMPIRIKGTPDNRYVLISCARSGDIALIDTESGKIIQSRNIGGVPIGIVIHPDMPIAFIARSEAKEVLAVNLPDLTDAFRLPTGNTPDGMAWVRDMEIKENPPDSP